MVLALLYASTSCCKIEESSVVINDYITATRAGESTFLVLHNTSRAMLPTYHRPPGNVGMLLIEVFLKLWELIEIPLFLPQAFTGIAELSSTTTSSSTVTTKARRTAAIAANKLIVQLRCTKSDRIRSLRLLRLGTVVSDEQKAHLNCVILWKYTAAIYFPASRGTMEEQPAFCIRIHAATWRKAD